MLSKKGQESAPFELLIAVIIMGFVIFFGLQALTQINKEQCSGKLNRNLEEFRIELEDVVQNNSVGKINFDLPSCYKGQEVKINKYNNSRICSAYCGIGRELCVVLELWTADGLTDRRCLNVSYNIDFEGSAVCGTGETLVDPDSSLLEGVIPEGYYTISNETLGQSFPTVKLCKKG